MKKFMTNIKTLAALLMAGAAMMFTACSSSDDDIIEQPTNPAQQKYAMTVKATKGDATTRALSLDGTTLNVKWNENEEVKVVQNNSVIGTLKAAASNDGSTTLTGTLNVAPVANQTLYFYLHSYPINYSGQNGVLLAADNASKSIEDDYDFAWASVLSGNFTIDNNIVTVPAGITLVSEQAIVKFTLQDASGADLNVKSLTIEDIAHNLSGGTSFITNAPLVVTPPAETGTNVLYVAISNLYDGKNSDLVLTATAANGDTYTYMKPYAGDNSIHFNHGQYYDITVKMKRLIDLSTLTSAQMPNSFYEAQNNEVLTGAFSTAYSGNYVKIANEAKVTVRDVTLAPTSASGILCGGDATIILEGNNNVTGGGNYPGIEAAGDNTTLTIKGSGSLIAKGGSNNDNGSAGIGSRSGSGNNCGDIVIDGGVITAIGGDDAAGIGAGRNAECSDITINGGNITATGTKDGAGIGSGYGSRNYLNTITITGGTIVATGGNGGGPGIGAGSGGAIGNIVISGGTVEAYGGYNGVYYGYR